MKEQFNVESLNEDFSLIFWNAKFHKNPVKFRSIAGSRDKVLCPLEQIIGQVFKKLADHFESYLKS